MSQRGLDSRFTALGGELKEAFAAWERAPGPWPEARFSELALRAFELQYEACEPYRRYCDRRGASPASIERWQDVPPASTAAFREVPLLVADAARARLEFWTSGTTRGPERRGRHLILDPELYRASLEASFFQHVLREPGEPVTTLRIGSLIPPFAATGDSSLAWMCDAVIARFGTPGSATLADRDGICWDEADAWVERACADSAALCLLATTLAAAEWTRRLAVQDRSFRLPPGSRIMDTGGAKGREGLERGRVVAAIGKRLGIPPRRVINEFGMTELLSQRYSRPSADVPASGAGRADPVGGRGSTAGRAPDPGSPRLWGPPWLRTRALDPTTLEELPDGELGVLCHFDLANLGSVCAVLTEDVGRTREGALEWVERAPGAPPRGCSLATAELIAAQEENRQ